MRGFLVGIVNSQVQLALRKNLFEADITIIKALETALYIEAVTRTGEEDKEQGQKNFCAEVSEVQKKPEIEIEIITAIQETALIIGEPIMTVECYHQNQEAGRKARIDCTRVLPSSRKQR